MALGAPKIVTVVITTVIKSASQVPNTTLSEAPAPTVSIIKEKITYVTIVKTVTETLTLKGKCTSFYLLLGLSVLILTLIMYRACKSKRSQDNSSASSNPFLTLS